MNIKLKQKIVESLMNEVNQAIPNAQPEDPPDVLPPENSPINPPPANPPAKRPPNQYTTPPSRPKPIPTRTNDIFPNWPGNTNPGGLPYHPNFNPTGYKPGEAPKPREYDPNYFENLRKERRLRP